MKNIPLNISSTQTITVTENLTANCVGSGSLPVFGTPMMVALMEKATCSAVKEFLENDETTVGTKIDVSHLSPTVVNKTVSATATVKSVDGRSIVFEVVANDETGLIGKGQISRFVVNSEKFMNKAENK